jgi:lipoate-protein ligase A
MVNGQKVAGAAQRRARGGLLHQGSIQYVDVGNGLAERFVQALSADCSERQIADEVLDLAWGVALQKYGTDAWLRRR